MRSNKVRATLSLVGCVVSIVGLWSSPDYAHAISLVDPNFKNVDNSTPSAPPGSPWHDAQAGTGDITGIDLGYGACGWTHDLYFATNRNDSGSTERVARLSDGGVEDLLVASESQLTVVSAKVAYTPNTIHFGPGGIWQGYLFINDNNREDGEKGGLLRLKSDGTIQSFGGSYGPEPATWAFAPVDWHTPASGFEAYLGQSDVGDTTCQSNLVLETAAGKIFPFNSLGPVRGITFGPGAGSPFGEFVYAGVGMKKFTSGCHGGAPIVRIDKMGIDTKWFTSPPIKHVSGLAFPPGGSLFAHLLYAFIGDGTPTGGQVVRIDSSGNVTTLATGLYGSQSHPRLLFSKAGERLYVSDFTTDVYQIVPANPPLWASDDDLSLVAGGTITFTLSVPQYANQWYFLAGSVSGTSPGTMVPAGSGTILVPLNSSLSTGIPDPYFLFTVSNPNTAPLPNSLGQLNGSGQAMVTFTIPPGTTSSLAGVTVYHAFVVLDASLRPVFASNPVAFTLEDPSTCPAG